MLVTGTTCKVLAAKCVPTLVFLHLFILFITYFIILDNLEIFISVVDLGRTTHSFPAHMVSVRQCPKYLIGVPGLRVLCRGWDGVSGLPRMAVDDAMDPWPRIAQQTCFPPCQTRDQKTHCHLWKIGFFQISLETSRANKGTRACPKTTRFFLWKLWAALCVECQDQPSDACVKWFPCGFGCLLLWSVNHLKRLVRSIVRDLTMLIVVEYFALQEVFWEKSRFAKKCNCAMSWSDGRQD